MERVSLWGVGEKGEPDGAGVVGFRSRREVAQQWRERMGLLDLRANLLGRDDRARIQRTRSACGTSGISAGWNWT
jgi:hypothetical protein